MLAFVIRRLGAGLLQILLITLLTWALFFLLARATGANPAVRLAGQHANLATIKRIEHHFGLDRSYPEQYGRFLWNALHLDFGESYVQQGRPVGDIILPAAGVTASLVLGAAVLWLLIAIPVGVIGALRPRSLADRGLFVLVLLGVSTPVFWVAPMLSYALGYEPTQGSVLGVPLPGGAASWFPIDGYVDLRRDPIGWAHHLILPWIAFAVGFAAIYARYVRALTIEQLGEDYVRTATAKGASSLRVLTRHVGRNVAPVIVTVLGVDIGIALSGTLFVEKVFGLPGLGYWGVSSILNVDYPLITGIVTFGGAIAVAANALVDIGQALLDPRVRLGAGAA